MDDSSWDIMLPSNRASVQHSRSPRMSLGPGNATVCRSGDRIAVQYCSISETCFGFFQATVFRKKRTARLSPAVQVREETPGKGSDSGGWGSYRVAYFANQMVPRIDEAQFLLTFRFFLTGGRLDRANPPTPQRMTSVKASTIRLI